MNRRQFFKRTSAFIAGIVGFGLCKPEAPVVVANGTDKEQEWAEFSVDTAIRPEEVSFLDGEIKSMIVFKDNLFAATENGVYVLADGKGKYVKISEQSS